MTAVGTNNLSAYFELNMTRDRWVILSFCSYLFLQLSHLPHYYGDSLTIKQQHQIFLYADDYCSYQIPSLAFLNDWLYSQCLKDFLGKKVNFHKSELIPITSVDVAYFGSVPSKFTYLGLWVTHDHMDLSKDNFLLLFNLKQDIECWQPSPRSLGGEINMTMSVLSKCLHSLQCLPIFLTVFIFPFEKQKSSFIWN